jgi:hypothetical protein
MLVVPLLSNNLDISTLHVVSTTTILLYEEDLLACLFAQSHNNLSNNPTNLAQNLFIYLLCTNGHLHFYN